MRDQLAALRAQIEPLELDATQRMALRDPVLAYAEAYLAQLPHGPAFRSVKNVELPSQEATITEAPIDIASALALLSEHVDHPGVQLGTPGYLAFIPVSGLYPAALGDYLAAVTNRFAGMAFASPGAVQLERSVLRWMADVVGYPATAAGDLTSGGSIANLSAIVTAREAHGLRAQDIPRVVVYRTAQTHHSITKALRIAGLGECVQRAIPLDDRWRMRPEALEAAIEQDRRAGLRPWLIVGTAGTTDTGAVDPLAALAEIAARAGLWLHVDGAYGAMFALCPSGRTLLQGMDRADSLTLDPHKGLFMPCGSGALLVRDGAALLQAYTEHGPYMQDRHTLTATDLNSPAELSPELTRPFRGLRLWLTLKVCGVAPFRAALEEKLLLARYAYAQLQTIERMTVGPPPDLSVVTFRYQPRHGDANVFNQRLIAAIQQDGRIFLSSTLIDGQVVLRLAVLSLTTHLETIDLALAIIRETAEALEG